MMERTEAEKIVDKIIRDLNDRSGLGFDCVDEDVRQEICEEWIRIVMEGVK